MKKESNVTKKKNKLFYIKILAIWSRSHLTNYLMNSYEMEGHNVKIKYPGAKCLITRDNHIV